MLSPPFREPRSWRTVSERCFFFFFKRLRALAALMCTTLSLCFEISLSWPIQAHTHTHTLHSKHTISNFHPKTTPLSINRKLSNNKKGERARASEILLKTLESICSRSLRWELFFSQECFVSRNMYYVVCFYCHILHPTTMARTRFVVETIVFFFASPRTRLDSNPINIIDARTLRTTTSRSCRVIDLRTRTNAHIQLCERGLVCFDCVRHFYADIYVFSLLVMLFFCFSWDSLSLSRLEILCFCWLFSRFRERILTARSLTGECSRWNSRGHL